MSLRKRKTLIKFVALVKKVKILIRKRKSLFFKQKCLSHVKTPFNFLQGLLNNWKIRSKKSFNSPKTSLSFCDLKQKNEGFLWKNARVQEIFLNKKNVKRESKKVIKMNF